MSLFNKSAENIYLVANWKMNNNVEDIRHFFETLTKVTRDFTLKSHTWIAPQAIHIPLVREEIIAINKSKNNMFKVGAQNCCQFPKGAYTGEVASESLKNIGAEFVIVGHSERRQYFGEVSDHFFHKISMALKYDLKIIYCVGETNSERENADHYQVVEKQLLEVFSRLESPNLSNILIAYEPVWAIGSGKTASVTDISEMHSFIRQTLHNKLHWTSTHIPILYGGSVKPSNFKEIIDITDVDGGLIGGASLKADDLFQLLLITSTLVGN